MSLAAELNAFPLSLSLSLAQLQLRPQPQLPCHYCQRNHDYRYHDYHYHCRSANPLAVLAKLLSLQQKVPPCISQRDEAVAGSGLGGLASLLVCLVAHSLAKSKSFAIH